MLDGISTAGGIAVLAFGLVFALWTFFLMKLIFLGKPRTLEIRAFGVQISVAPPKCPVCNKEEVNHD